MVRVYTRALFPSALAVAWAAALVVAFAPSLVPAAEAPGPLRVCADPNNLPFSNERGEGFDNRTRLTFPVGGEGFSVRFTTTGGAQLWLDADNPLVIGATAAADAGKP